MMALDSEQEKMEQAKRISNVGCFAIVLTLIIVVLIASAVIRADLSTKRGNALTVLSRIREQVDKAPGVLDRMLAYDCGSDAEDAVSSAEGVSEGLTDDANISEVESAWQAVEDAWAEINRGCRSSLDDPAFVDLTTEMEGLRNRISVEKGNYTDVAEVYNSALTSFPANLVSGGFEKM